MKKIIFVLIIILASTVSAQELDLDKIADDRKYNNAHALIKLDQNSKAMTALQEYLEIFIRGNHRHEAYLAIASIYFHRFEYQKAVKTYLSLYEEFSRDEKGIEGYFRAGICYKKMGFNAKAGEIFKEIVAYHPSSSWARQSQLQLDIMKIISSN